MSIVFSLFISSHADREADAWMGGQTDRSMTERSRLKYKNNIFAS
jgi:hypothetical protein